MGQEKPVKRTTRLQKGVQEPQRGFQMRTMPCVRDKRGTRPLASGIFKKVVPICCVT